MEGLISLRWQNILTIWIMVLALALVLTVIGQFLHKKIGLTVEGFDDD